MDFPNFDIVSQMFSKNLTELQLLFNPQQEVLAGEICEESKDLPRKRGRKKLRPHNPTKTEVMDKFWLRGFREFMKSNYLMLKDYLGDLSFWEKFLGKQGIPGKKGPFLSYSKEYKRYLFASTTFCMLFTAWSCLYGMTKIPRRNFKGNWELYYEYLFAELVSGCKKNVENNEYELKNTISILSIVFDRQYSRQEYFCQFIDSGL